jgi:REP element-mobilizing transposase RayT
MGMHHEPGSCGRRSLRLKEYDYSRDGAYFVTICAHRRLCRFGRIAHDDVQLNAEGRIIASCWNEIPKHFPTVSLDAWVIMPNHLHGIIIITTDDTNIGSSASLGIIVGAFKSAATKRINQSRAASGSVWQRNYYEHVIRDESSLNRSRKYIEENPARWAYDRENPGAIPEV